MAWVMPWPASADFFQGFESDRVPWYDSSNGWYGGATRVASGTNGIASADGNWHAAMSSTATGPYADYGTNLEFNPAGFISVDLYLDTGWAANTGLDLTTAMGTQTGAHLRDYNYHVGVVGSSLQVNAGTTTAGAFWAGHFAQGSYAVPTSGWYTFEWDIQDGGGYLAMGLNLRDSSSALLWSTTLASTGDLTATIAGGPLYSWFPWITTTNGTFAGVAADNHLFIVPEPSALMGLLLGAVPLLLGRRRRKQAVSA
jgi:hypothetical protein